MCSFWSITISDVIALLALAAATWAAWAAAISNQNTKKSMEESRTQFRENMHEQNRAVNVSLFDLRTEILTSIETGEFTFNRTRARLLFNDSIAEAIENYDNAKQEERRYAGLKREYLARIQSKRADDTYEEATDLLRQLDDYSQMNPDDPSYEQVKEILRKHSLTGKWTHGANPFEVETVNYVDTEEAENSYYTEANKLKERLIKIVKQFIEDSIQ